MLPQEVPRAKNFNYKLNNFQRATGQRIFARVSLYRRDSTYNNYFNDIATGVTFQFLARSAVFDHVVTLSPTTVWNNRYSYSRFIRYQEGNRDADGFDLTKLGFPAAYNNAIPSDVRTFPQFNMTGYIPTASAASDPVARMPLRVLMKNRFIKLVQALRCVPTAPLGRPVVPDV